MTSLSGLIGLLFSTGKLAGDDSTCEIKVIFPIFRWLNIVIRKGYERISGWYCKALKHFPFKGNVNSGFISIKPQHVERRATVSNNIRPLVPEYLTH